MKQIDVGWCVSSDRFAIAFDAPSTLIPTKDSSKLKKSFLSCPAVRQFSEGMFHVTSPFSLKLRVIETDVGLSIVPVYPFTSLAEDFVKQLVQIEQQDTWQKNNLVVIQIPSPYVFISDEPLLIEQSSPELSSVSKLNWRVIPGKFDIYAWQRPLNWAFEWDVSCGDFEIRVGEPQYKVRFFSTEIPVGSYSIKLNNIIFDENVSKRLELTKDISKVRKGTLQLFKRAAELRKNENFLKK